MNKIVCLWSSPRNVSTALMYSFAQRKDVKVFDEPLYAHYLKSSGALHPGREEILTDLENNGNKVVKELILQKSKKILFHKLMTHFLIDIDDSFLLDIYNIIFIRDPKKIIHSYSKIIQNPTMHDIGIKKQYELYVKLKERECSPIVLDSTALLKEPENILRRLCDLLSISFDINMLRWNKGGIKEDGIWAKYWYKNVHNSTGFIPYNSKSISLNKDYAKLADHCMPYYNFLIDKAITL